MKSSLLTAGLFAATLLTACDDSFSPIEPSNLQFSIFGYLDASADTQWIRVMPVRPVATTEAGPLAARVTLEEVGSGRVVELRDSVFRYSAAGELDSDGVYLHNYWTTEPIEPGATYRFRVSREGEPPAEAEVKVPPDFDVEVWLKQLRSGGDDTLRLAGVEHLALVEMYSHLYGRCGSAVERDLVPILPSDAGVVKLSVSKFLRLTNGCTQKDVVRQELRVAASGTEWPSTQEFSASRLGPGGGPSNVTHAVGFLGGVLTKVIPYEVCTIASVPPSSGLCRLQYDEDRATLSGTIADVTCEGRPAVLVTIDLRELEPDPLSAPRIRSAVSDENGAYRISALEPGRRYALSMHRFLLPLGELYYEHLDTVQFAPGEHATHDARLQRLRACDAR